MYSISQNITKLIQIQEVGIHTLILNEKRVW